jgi:hypothetical protein
MSTIDRIFEFWEPGRRAGLAVLKYQIACWAWNGGVPFQATVADWIMCWNLTGHRNGCPLCDRRYSAERVSKERTITLGKAPY